MTFSSLSEVLIYEGMGGLQLFAFSVASGL